MKLRRLVALVALGLAVSPTFALGAPRPSLGASVPVPKTSCWTRGPSITCYHAPTKAWYNMTRRGKITAQYAPVAGVRPPMPRIPMERMASLYSFDLQYQRSSFQNRIQPVLFVLIASGTGERPFMMFTKQYVYSGVDTLNGESNPGARIYPT